MKLGITAALVILASACQMGIVGARILPIYNNKKFRSRPLVGKKNGTVSARGNHVVKTVELVAA